MGLIETLKRSVRWRYHLIPLPLSYGVEFRRKYKFLQETRHWSEEQLNDYVWQHLKAIIEFAYKETRFYRDQFDKLGCHPKDIKSFDDYRKLPTINRDTVLDNLENMKPRCFESTVPIRTVTSGTTGYPLKLYRSKSLEMLRRAIVWRHFHDIGYKFKQRRVTLGRPIEFPDKQVFHIHDVLENNILLNSFHLNPQDFLKLYDRAVRAKPRMIFGHPSALLTFCLQARDLDLPALRVPIIYTVSEKLYPHHVEAFNRFFAGDIFDYYGNRENTLAVTQNSCGSYHINSEFGYVEFIADGKPVQVGEQGSVISTSLENYSVPLLRYDTGDIGKPLGVCPNCDRPHPTMEIMGGRGKDLLVTRDGFVNCHLDTYLSRKGFKGAKYLQVVQKEIDRVTVRIMPTDQFDNDCDDQRLRELTKECLGGYFEVDIEHLTEPPFTEAGKMPYVISELAKKTVMSGVRIDKENE